MTRIAAIDIFESLSYINTRYIEEADADRAVVTNRSLSKTVRTLLIAAVIAALLTGVAYGASLLFKMNITENTAPISQDFLGVHVTYNDVGLVLSFEGPEVCHQVGFKADYLPSEPTNRVSYPDGEWYRALCDESDDLPEIGYNIYSDQASLKTSLMIGGKAEIVKEYSSGDLQVVEIVSDYTGTSFEYAGVTGANFIIVFDTADGCLVRIASNRYGLDELEKILAGMELYVYMETNTPERSLDYGFINPGRG